MIDSLLITSAAVFAAEAHKNCIRKDLNEPYIVHPLRVAKMASKLGLPDTDIAAAMLHDVPEDTDVPMYTIEKIFPQRTSDLVKALTKWWEADHPSDVLAANKAAYYHNIVKTDGALVLKFLDRIDNLHDFTKIARMAPSSHGWAQNYYNKTKREFSPLIENFLQSGMHLNRNQQVVHWYTNAMNNLENAL